MPMQLSETEAQQLDAILDQYDRHPAVQQMRQYIQHGSVTTYEHCRNVVLVQLLAEPSAAPGGGRNCACCGGAAA